MDAHRPPLRVDEMAELLRVDRRTIVRAIKRGDLYAARFGAQYLIPVTEAERYTMKPAA